MNNLTQSDKIPEKKRKDKKSRYRTEKEKYKQKIQKCRQIEQRVVSYKTITASLEE